MSPHVNLGVSRKRYQIHAHLAVKLVAVRPVKRDRNQIQVRKIKAKFVAKHAGNTRTAK